MEADLLRHTSSTAERFPERIRSTHTYGNQASEGGMLHAYQGTSRVETDTDWCQRVDNFFTGLADVC